MKQNISTTTSTSILILLSAIILLSSCGATVPGDLWNYNITIYIDPIGSTRTEQVDSREGEQHLIYQYIYRSRNTGVIFWAIYRTPAFQIYISRKF